ncbi:ABC transporter ATP-binding protein [Streptosporangium sandarakinum]|uniref:ATP-binding cassette subfamily B protein n=2 Tax=Streptosporangium sandarakinum TaxID=1260955 RepID=A0A852V6G4_9ACTN|nr:ATP-binding cassette subfamily B protein [Streptosporangium sandarakinum]
MRMADRLLAQTVRRGGPWLGVLAVSSVAGALAELALPYALGRAVDALVAAGPAGGAWTWAGVCAALVAGAVACDALGVWGAGVSGAQATAWLRLRALRHVLGAGPALTRRLPEGDLVTRMGVNAEEAGRAPEALVTAAALVIPSAGGIVALTLIDVRLALTLVCGLVLITFVLRAFLRAGTSIAGGYQEAQGDIAARLVDALAGARTIAAAGTGAAEKARVLAALPRLRGHAMDMWRANASAGVRAGAVVPLLEVAVLAVGGLRLADGGLTAGELYSAARYVVLGAGIGSALGQVARLARARAAAVRITELTAGTPRAYGESPLPAGPGTLELRGVRAEGLGEIDLVVPGGCSVAVVGRSGSGKSALAALAGRLADPAAGTVLLDGVPLPRLSPGALRRAVGYAFERPVLVGDTVEEAVGLGLDEPDPRAVRRAAREACADAFVRRLPLGYGTRLDDAPMSGGERQRLGLARAFAHGRRLLVLDDATSSLDTVTERQVAAALAGRLGGRTRLVVTHRAATAAAADRVIWLDGGRVRGYGTHRALWRDPAYRAVFQADGPPPGPPGSASGPPGPPGPVVATASPAASPRTPSAQGTP